MITRRFDYLAPGSADEAVAALAGNGETAVIGGGTWVVPEMTHGIRRPARVVDLRRAGLAGVEAGEAGLVVGATTTYTELASDPLVAERAPALAAMAAGVTGGAQVRNQGTIGGSACYATPSSDAPGALVGLGARMRIASSAGTRELDAADFFLGAFTCALAPGELLTAVVVPEAPNAVQGYYKHKLCESSWPIATACCSLELAADGTVASGRLAVGGVNAVPYLVDLSGLAGRRLGSEAAGEAAALAEQGATDPYTDVLASGGYRRQIAGVVAKRALLAAAGREGER
jgi:CO/xanthine dehydrogenase FAD-binding subunit